MSERLLTLRVSWHLGQEGKEVAVEVVRKEAWTVGYEKGFLDGYKDGYKVGWDEGSREFTKLVVGHSKGLCCAFFGK